MRVWSNRGGVTTGDVMIIIAVIVLGGALVLPFVRERARRYRLRETVTAVEALRTAAVGHFESNDDWPARTEPGVEPPELAGAVPASLMASEHHVLQWLQWELVEEPAGFQVDEPERLDEVLPGDTLDVPLPRPTLHAIGGIAVHSSDKTLLAGLLGRYGRSSSFVRDSVWTLVMPTRSGPR